MKHLKTFVDRNIHKYTTSLLAKPQRKTHKADQKWTLTFKMSWGRRCQWNLHCCHSNIKFEKQTRFHNFCDHVLIQIARMVEYKLWNRWNFWCCSHVYRQLWKCNQWRCQTNNYSRQFTGLFENIRSTTTVFIISWWEFLFFDGFTTWNTISITNPCHFIRAIQQVKQIALKKMFFFLADGLSF